MLLVPMLYSITWGEIAWLLAAALVRIYFSLRGCRPDPVAVTVGGRLVPVAVRTGVLVLVWVAVAVGPGVAVLAAVWLGVLVIVAVRVREAVPVGVRLRVLVTVAVRLGETVAVGRGRLVLVTVPVAGTGVVLAPETAPTGSTPQINAPFL